MINYEFLNNPKTSNIYSKLVELDSLYTTDSRAYCREARILAERILRYLVTCCQGNPSQQCGVNLDYLKDFLPDYIFTEILSNEFSTLLKVTNAYHHDDETTDSYRDRLTVYKSIEHILPCLVDIDKNIAEYIEVKARRKKKTEKAIGYGIFGLIGAIGLALLGINHKKL